MGIQNYNVYEGLTAVDYVSTINVSGTYYNGTLNNGIDSFLSIPSGVFSIDSNQIKTGDTILLAGQTNQNENGIYICIQTDDIYSFSVIQRRPDFHSVEQMRAGQYISCGKGATNAGLIFTLADPIPNLVGVDPILFVCPTPNLNNFAVAGTSAGQAGDTAHCNAQNVLKVTVNGTDKFIPLFDTN